MRRLTTTAADLDARRDSDTNDNAYTYTYALAVTHAQTLPSSRRSLVLVAGLLLGLALTATTLGTSWEHVALGLGIGLAAIVGLSQTCSA